MIMLVLTHGNLADPVQIIVSTYMVANKLFYTEAMKYCTFVAIQSFQSSYLIHHQGLLL